jgi:hypothetical protein
MDGFSSNAQQMLYRLCEEMSLLLFTHWPPWIGPLAMHAKSTSAWPPLAMMLPADARCNNDFSKGFQTTCGPPYNYAS